MGGMWWTVRSVYIPIWTIKDSIKNSHSLYPNTVYIPIWTIKDSTGADLDVIKSLVYIPIWTIKDFIVCPFSVKWKGGLHSNMDD